MVRVKIRHVRAGVAGASGLVMIGNAAACVLNGHDDGAQATTAADTAATPGAGTLTLGGGVLPNSESYAFTLTQSSTDEFVRVGERLTISLPSYYLWIALHPSDGVPIPDAAHLGALKVTVEAQFIGAGDVRGRASVDATWSGTDSWSMTATTASFVVPSATDTLAFGITIEDPIDGTRVELASLDFATVPVFGGEIPLKHALFDNDGPTLRQRIIEGGHLVAGASTVLSYSDWRADEMVDKMMLDREIGQAESYGRFGPMIVPIYGDLVYEITSAFSFDGTSFTPEIPMNATTHSRVENGQGRTAYETTIYAPTNATKLDIYFHVKAFLVVDYSKYGNSVVSRRYNQGDRILLREHWDNLNGQAFQNYELPVGGP
jgi:hypothetical protein